MKNRLFSRISACFNHTPTESHKQNHTSEHGRSMIEMLGVLTIIAVLTIIGMFGYTQAIKKVGLNKQASQVNDFVAGMVAFLNKSGSADLTKTTLMSYMLQLGYIPDTMVKDPTSTTAYLDYLGNQVYIYTAYADSITLAWDFASTEQYVNIEQVVARYSSKINQTCISWSKYIHVGDRRCNQSSNTYPCLSTYTLSELQEDGSNYPTGNTVYITFYRR